MLVLFETSAGYAVFKLLDEKKLNKVDDLYSNFETPERASKVLKLKNFTKFEDTTEALAATTAAVEGKMSKTLKKMLKKLVVKEAHEQLAVADAKLGNVIKDKLSLSCVSNNAIQELMRCIRSQSDSLIAGLPKKELTAMQLGLAHSLSRYKLKFSPDKVDTMIVQAISLLDDLDKELNNYVMRAREWYGWHFPELGKIVTDNLAFAKVVKLMGVRTNAVDTDFSAILPEEVESEMKTAAEISMGTEVSEEDITNIIYLCDQVIDITDYRAQLYDYVKNRMMAIAPNTTALVGELVGARLIAHAGSLLNLAKHPSSTVQILGAEKALFRALKTKHDTPKYGLIYHAQLVGQTNPKYKGKISRMLAAKTALAIRVDALGEDVSSELGIEQRARLEQRMKMMEEGFSRKISGSGKQKAKFEKYENKSEVRTYNSAADSTIPTKKRKFDDDNDAEPASKRPLIEELQSTLKQECDDDTTTKKKKKKKNKTQDADSTMESTVNALAASPKSEKKRKSRGGGDADMNSTAEHSVLDTSTVESEKKKKKKKKKAKEEAE